jgi:CHAT domain-containing protein/tetratricopeptide (TPR) repeat protein
MRDRVAICFEKFTRPRVRTAVLAVFAACIGACTDRARDPVEAFATRVAITGDAPVSVTRSLQRGAYLVEVREQEVDLRVRIEAGATSSTLEDRAPRYGAIYKIVSFESPGELRIEISSADHKSKRGNAAVRIARWTREPGAVPGELEAGYRAQSEAGELAVVADPQAWTRAADKLHEAVTHFDAAGDDAARGEAAYALAYIQYGPRDQYAAAVRACETAAEAFARAGNEIGVQNATMLRAATEIDLAAAMSAETQRAEQRALYSEADRRLEEAARFFVARGLPLRAQYAVNMRAMRAINLGDYEGAARLFSEAVAMAKGNDDIREQARSLGNLAAVHVYLGQTPQAARQYEALLPLLDRNVQEYQYAALLGNYGVTLIDLGDFDRALAAHNEALEIYKKLGEKSELAVERAQLGSLYLRMGDADRALRTLDDAITEHEQAADAQPLAGTLRLAANSASMLERHAVALEYLQRAARVDANPHGVARTRVLMAGELRALGKPQAAAAELVEPLKSTNKIVLASALEERARLRLATRQTREAIEDLRAADHHYVELGLEFDRIELKTALSRALLDTGDIAGAGAAADDAISIVSHIRVKSANPEWRARFLSARYSPYEARIAVDLASGNPDSAWRAFRVAEDVRARSLSDELAGGGAKLRAVDPEEDALRSRLTSLQLRLESSLQVPNTGDGGSSALRRAITETSAQIDAISARHGVAASESSLPEALAQVQGALPPGTAVLAYFVGDSSSYAWLLNREELRHETLPGRRRLEQLIVATQREQRGGSGGNASRELGAMLFGNLLVGVKDERLLVLADGPLNSVPFAALALPRTSGVPLVERFAVGNAPSLALAMSSPTHARSRNTRVAVIFDPIYAADDRRLHVARNSDGSNWRGPPAPSRNGFTRLPYSALEASAVVRAFGPADTIQLSGFDAIPERVLALRARELAVLHFATHAVTHENAPDQSALFLTEYSRDGALLGSSRVTALDIARSGLHADVVVLSACGTGDGSALRGEGVLGLTYEFLANGSHSVVASLWPIEDASTARFMNEFYRAYRETGRAADALRTAQLRVRATSTSSVWSSFVVRANEFP